MGGLHNCNKLLTSIKSKKNEMLSVKFVKTQHNNAVYFKVKSHGKVIKETDMKSLFEGRLEDDLQKISFS